MKECPVSRDIPAVSPFILTPQEPNSWGQNVDQWLPGAGGEGLWEGEGSDR